MSEMIKQGLKLVAINRYKAYIKASEVTFDLDSQKSIKQLYSETLGDDLKYQRCTTKKKDKS